MSAAPNPGPNPMTGPDDEPGRHRCDRVGEASSTARRRAVAATLATHDGFVSAQHLHAQLRLDGQTNGLNTVYRTLYELAEAGDVDRVHDAHTGWLFRARTARGHDHYLRCRDCGTATAITRPDLEVWTRRGAEQAGYTEVEHTIALTGRCPDCTHIQRPPR